MALAFTICLEMSASGFGIPITRESQLRRNTKMIITRVLISALVTRAILQIHIGHRQGVGIARAG